MPTFPAIRPRSTTCKYRAHGSPRINLGEPLDFERLLMQTKEYLEYIVEDAVKDYNYLEAND